MRTQTTLAATKADDGDWITAVVRWRTFAKNEIAFRVFKTLIGLDPDSIMPWRRRIILYRCCYLGI